MNSSNLLEHVYLCLRKYWRVWIPLMIIGFIVSVAYNKLIATKTYSARQSLILRDDLMGDAYKPSRFESQESLKSAQETVLEIARKPQVVRAVLEQLGPTSSFSFGASEYPSAETIEDVQGNITLSAPNGAEFGKTEAVVLSVKTSEADRSRKFVNLLLDEIDSKLSEVRMLRLGSMQSELSQAGDNARKSLNKSSQRLQELEKSFGAEITTIRGLNDPQGSGGFDLKINQIRLEQRQAAAQLSSAKQQRELLQQARDNGGADFVTSNELLELQPALQGIMTNLSATMAQMAIDEGRYTELHPALLRSRRAVKQQKRQLFDSIGTTILGLDSQIQTLSSLDRRLRDSITQLETKLENLTEQRVPYATLEEEVMKKAEVYNEVQGRLAQVQSYASSTEEVAMLTRVDEPQVSSRADQIGAFNAGLLGSALGLMLGLGLVALLAPPFVDPRTSHIATQLNQSARVAESSPAPAPVVSTQPAPAPQPTPDPVAKPQETTAESRLKSVAARQRTASSRDQEPQSSSAGNSVGQVKRAVDSLAPESVSQQLAEKHRIKDALPTAAIAAAAASAASVASAASNQEVPSPENTSTNDMIAELKKLKGETSAAASGSSSIAGRKTSEDSQVVTGEEVVVTRRPTLSSFVNSTPESGNEADSESNDGVTVDRIRSPEVPDSITKGRITAESLLKSAEKNKGPESSQVEQPQPTIVLQDGALPPTDEDNLDSRIPSIADYARSLDRKLGSTDGDRIAVSQDDVTSGPAVDTPPPVSSVSNVRPLDIAKSIEDPALLREPESNVQPNENNPESSQSRSKSISDYVGGVAGLSAAGIGAAAGLVSQASSSDVEVAEVRPTEDSVAASEKIAAEPTPEAQATPVPRDESSADAIPVQIRELSGSFSSFARPVESAGAEDESKS